MLRLSSYLALAGLAFFVAAGAARAEDEKWTVAEVAGAASVAAPMVASHPVAKGDALAPGATLTTGANGKIVFGDGKTVVTVSANSRLTMPADPSDVMTRFMQDMGSVFFKVEKRPMQHFEVQTPLVAAVVKGTQFTVTAGKVEHSVEVSEGLVEVVAMTGGQKELVPAGRSARVRRDAPKKVKVAGDPFRLASATITQAIGLDPIDYATATGGLVTTTTGLTTAGSEGGSHATNETNGTNGSSGVAVDLGAGTTGGVVANVDVGLGHADGGVGVAVGVDGGVGVGGGGGVGVGVDLGASAGGSGGTSVTVGAGVDLGGTTTTVGVGVGAGSGGGVGIGVGVGVGGTPPGQAGSGSGGTTVGIGVGVGGTPPGQSGGSGGVSVGVGASPGQSGTGVDVGVGPIHIGVHIGGGPHG